jgi:polyisoprenoid-binding protein YceI
MDVNTLSTQNSYRDKSLKDEGFFNVAKYPKIIFESSEIVRDTVSKEFNFTAKGQITIKGITKAANIAFNYVGVELKDMGEDGKFNVGGFEGKTTINRLDFGIGESGSVGENVTINLNLEVMQAVK